MLARGMVWKAAGRPPPQGGRFEPGGGSRVKRSARPSSPGGAVEQAVCDPALRPPETGPLNTMRKGARGGATKPTDAVGGLGPAPRRPVCTKARGLRPPVNAPRALVVCGDVMESANGVISTPARARSVPVRALLEDGHQRDQPARNRTPHGVTTSTPDAAASAIPRAGMLALPIRAKRLTSTHPTLTYEIASRTPRAGPVARAISES